MFIKLVFSSEALFGYYFDVAQKSYLDITIM